MNLPLRTARRALCGAFLGFLLVPLGACGNSGSTAPAGSVTTPKPSAAKSRTVNVGVNPQNTALDPATHTL